MAGTGDLHASFAAGDGDGGGYTYLNEMYTKEAAQFEEAVRRSLADQQAQHSVPYRAPTIDLHASIDEMNPAALIFATGTWGRMQDVDSTLF